MALLTAPAIVRVAASLMPVSARYWPAKMMEPDWSYPNIPFAVREEAFAGLRDWYDSQLSPQWLELMRGVPA